jgi:hypothetical protein
MYHFIGRGGYEKNIGYTVYIQTITICLVGFFSYDIHKLSVRKGYCKRLLNKRGKKRLVLYAIKNNYRFAGGRNILAKPFTQHTQYDFTGQFRKFSAEIYD